MYPAPWCDCKFGLIKASLLLSHNNALSFPTKKWGKQTANIKKINQSIAMSIKNKRFPEASKALDYIYSHAEFELGWMFRQMQWSCSYFPSRNSMRGLSMVSASASAVLWLGGPLIWYRSSAIWRMQPLMRVWKLGEMRGWMRKPLQG